jgi:uncharacterized damage-inducible protein DinB
MPSTPDDRLFDVLLDSWDRSNKILVNLLRAVPRRGMEAKSTSDGPCVAQIFTHIHFVRLVFVLEDAPDYARELPREEWALDLNRPRIEQMLNESAAVVRDAVKGMLHAGRQMQLHYDHPILLIQHMLWHEAYHHGQIKLALKVAGCPLADEQAGPLTWHVWMDKT